MGSVEEREVSQSRRWRRSKRRSLVLETAGVLPPLNLDIDLSELPSGGPVPNSLVRSVSTISGDPSQVETIIKRKKSTQYGYLTLVEICQRLHLGDEEGANVEVLLALRSMWSMETVVGEYITVISTDISALQPFFGVIQQWLRFSYGDFMRSPSSWSLISGFLVQAAIENKYGKHVSVSRSNRSLSKAGGAFYAKSDAREVRDIKALEHRCRFLYLLAPHKVYSPAQLHVEVLRVLQRRELSEAVRVRRPMEDWQGRVRKKGSVVEAIRGERAVCYFSEKYGIGGHVISGVLGEMRSAQFLMPVVADGGNFDPHVYYAIPARAAREESTIRADVGVAGLPAHVLMKELTLMEVELWSGVQYDDLLGQKWVRSGAEVRALMNLIDQSNRVSQMIAYEVVSHIKVKGRVQAIEHLVKAAELCERLGNFNSMMQIVAGLTMSPVSRLKKTWKEVKKSRRATLDRLCSMTAGVSNFKEYRASKALCRGKCIPSLSVMLKDLTFIEDGNPQADAMGRANVDRLAMLGKVLMEVKQCQQLVLPFESDVVARGILLKSLAKVVDEETLMVLSGQCEVPARGKVVFTGKK